jgi:hypothetical protein
MIFRAKNLPVTSPVPEDKQQVLDSLLSESSFSTRIRGDCMMPVISNDSLITVEPHTSLTFGDIMVWRDLSGQMVCHRYLGRFPTRSGVANVSWADNANSPDALVPSSRILGKVTAVNHAPVSVSWSGRARAGLRYFRYVIFRVGRKLKP